MRYILLAPQRHAHILEAIAKANSISIRALSKTLGVSRETLRKDIETLSTRNELTQIRGGAMRVQTAESPISNRVSINSDGKNKIAQIVAKLIPDNASIMIDNGVTTQTVARALLHRHKNLTIYTNDLKIAEILIPIAREIIMLGGRIDKNEFATHGLETIENLAKYRAEYALISAGGLNESDLFTDFTHEAAVFRDTMLAYAEHPIILVDQSKFGKLGQVKLKPPKKGVCIVMDIQPPNPIKTALTTHNFNLIWE